MGLPDCADEVEAVLVLHDQIRDHDVELGLLHVSLSRAHVAGSLNFHLLQLEEMREHGADFRVVVHHEDSGHAASTEPPGQVE